MIRSSRVCLATAALCAILSRGSAATTVDLDSGITGTTLPGQSFNETRGADILILAPEDLRLTSMTLRSFNVGGASSAVLAARVYDTASGLWIAGAATTVGSGANQTATIPITATLRYLRTYRGCFFLGVDGFAGSGPLFLPSSLPYTDPLGLIRVTGLWSGLNDAFPTNANIGVPLISLNVSPQCGYLAFGSFGTTTSLGINGTRAIELIND